MPELPEVELTRRHVAPVVCGAVVDHTEVRHERMLRRQPPMNGGGRIMRASIRLRARAMASVPAIIIFR